MCVAFNYIRENQRIVTGKGEEVAEKYAKEILRQWRLKAALHQTGAVFIELGDDFTYSLKEQTEKIYDNYKVCIRELVHYWRWWYQHLLNITIGSV